MPRSGPALGHNTRPYAPADSFPAVADGRGAADWPNYRAYPERLLVPGAVSAPRWLGGSPSATQEALSAIAGAMIAGADDLILGGPGPIPAGYTYFGQFVVHDLVFSRVFRREGPAGAHAVEGRRRLGLDLQSFYGSDPVSEPHLYRRPERIGDMRCRFVVGTPAPSPMTTPLTDAERAVAGDIARVAVGDGATGAERAVCRDPLIADPRNDHHLIISQMHLALQRGHNRMVDLLLGRDFDPETAYWTARRFLVGSFQRAIADDLLVRLLHPTIHRIFAENRADTFEAPGLGRIVSEPPLEFGFGVARAGHALARRFYRVNRIHSDVDIGLLTQFSGDIGRADQIPVSQDWSIDWAGFFPMPGSRQVPKSARRIGPFVAEPIAMDGTIRIHGRPRSLLFLDLWRCYEAGVPTGQEIAAELDRLIGPFFFGAFRPGVGIPVLSGDEMRPTAAFRAAYPFGSGLLDDALDEWPDFLTATPLFYYVLQEAAVLGSDGGHLGPVGSFVFASTVRAAMPPDGPGGAEGDIGFVHAQLLDSVPDLIGLSDRDRFGDVELYRLLTGLVRRGARTGRHRRTGIF